MKKRVVIIGAGPAGLTAGYELLKFSDRYDVLILEEQDAVGGIARTVEQNNIRLDIGGHRYFSDDPVITKWWKDLCGEELQEVHRKSDVLFNGSFYPYPVKLRLKLLQQMGLSESIRIISDYISVCLNRREELSLRDLYINRFGKRLYEIFFEDYTRKVLGRTADAVSPEWGRQRVGRISISRALLDGVGRALGLPQRKEQASLTDWFLYPRRGSGEMWENVADRIRSMGGSIRFHKAVRSLEYRNGQIEQVICGDGESFVADMVISTMALRELIRGMTDVPADIRQIADRLEYRNFIIVGLRIPREQLEQSTIPIEDQWLYIQESKTALGRIQIFDNWSDSLNSIQGSVCLGLEYFCSPHDEVWERDEVEWVEQGKADLKALGVFHTDITIQDSTVIRCEKAYPCYWGGFYELQTLLQFTDDIPNLYCAGRNGRHSYSNMDQVILSAMDVVKVIANGSNTR